jgi:cardiolipin synthase
MDLQAYLLPGWQIFLIFLGLLMAGLTSSHAVMYKRDARSALLWVAFIWFLPIAGSLLYGVLGVNRVRRRALILRGDMEQFTSCPAVTPGDPENLQSAFGEELDQWRPHFHALRQITSRPLLPGNSMDVLVNGEEAYPAMVHAIDQAQETVGFASYIFDHCPAGIEFVEAFRRAKNRGVEVRVLVDSTGSLYSWPTIFKALHEAAIPCAKFLSFSAIKRPLTLNLHNHRKLLVVDGRIGFTGGMNIRQGHMTKSAEKNQVQDLQFKFTGPVVAHMQEAFVNDWYFSSDERLSEDLWFPSLGQTGEVYARGITDGPDEDLDKLLWTLLSACHTARKSIHIMTPYFLPDASLISALCLAAMRGVEVHILLPAKNNLPFVQWATHAMLWQVLVKGCRVWESPPPFEHGKLMLVDGHWALVGSSNWDARSLRLNFEFNVECYHPGTVRHLERILDSKIAQSKEVTLEDMDARSVPVRIRDGVMRLATPYL